MHKHKLILLGDSHGELRVSAAALHETVGALLEGARQATRFIVEGESTRSGPRPTWLDAVCEIEITGLSAFFGTWPGDESDEELLEALQAIG